MNVAWSRLEKLEKALPLAAVLAPIALALALIPARGHVNDADLAMILMVAVVGLALTGRRLPAAVCSLLAAASFDFFFTRPYYSFRIDRETDLITTALLLGLGLVIGEMATRGRLYREAAREHRDGLSRIVQVAERIATGEEADYVVTAVAGELRELLKLRDCEFTRDRDPGATAAIEPDGSVVIGNYGWAADRLGFPTERIELPVRSGGRRLGSFVLTPAVAVEPVPLERRLLAVALADQLGSLLAQKV